MRAVEGVSVKVSVKLSKIILPKGKEFTFKSRIYTVFYSVSSIQGRETFRLEPDLLVGDSSRAPLFILGYYTSILQM